MYTALCKQMRQNPSKLSPYISRYTASCNVQVTRIEKAQNVDFYYFRSEHCLLIAASQFAEGMARFIFTFAQIKIFTLLCRCRTRPIGPVSFASFLNLPLQIRQCRPRKHSKSRLQYRILPQLSLHIPSIQ